MHPKTHRNRKNSSSAGFIQIIIIIIVALVILRLLGISITSVLSSPWAHDFAVFVKDMLISVWNDIKAIFGFIKSA